MSSSASNEPQGLVPTAVYEVDPGTRLMQAFVKELLRRMEDPEIAGSMSAAELTLINTVCRDNSVTLVSIRRGDFGNTAQRVAEEFPFPDGPQVMVQ